jgi:hypothetical protein
VAQVEALREKRAFDAALPPLDDLKRLPLRLALVQQWEAREWEGREADLEVVQQQQLELMERKILVRPGPAAHAPPCCGWPCAAAGQSLLQQLYSQALHTAVVPWLVLASAMSACRSHVQVLTAALCLCAPQAREEEMDLRRQQRVEATAAASATRHGVALETIHAGRIKTLRHLAQARRKVDPKEASK